MGQSQTDQVYATIKKDIITCSLAPGQQIAQPQLAERYGAGITPIREALQRLAQEGLVQPVPRYGYIVAPITLSDMAEIYESRSMLESAAARLAAQRATQEQLEQLAALAEITYVYRDHGSYSEFLAHNTEFHRAVALAAGNRRLVEWISLLLDELTRVFHLGLDLKDSAEEMRGEHRQLVEALRRRDPDAAEYIVKEQIARSQGRVLEALISQAAGGSLSLMGQALQVK